MGLCPFCHPTKPKPSSVRNSRPKGCRSVLEFRWGAKNVSHLVGFSSVSQNVSRQNEGARPGQPRKEVPKRFPKLKKWHGGESLDISRPTPQGGGETICETHLEVPCLFLGALPLGMRPEEAPLPHAPPPGAKFLPSTCSSHCQIGAAPSAPHKTETHLSHTHLQNHAATNTTPGTFK